MRYLSSDEIIHINAQTIKEHGGNFVPPRNLLREGGLEYLVEIVQQEIFGEKVFNTIPEIAAAYLFYIVDGHIFQDGNKRTGLASCLIFLKMNSAWLNPNATLINSTFQQAEEVTNEEKDVLYELTMALASGQLTLDQLKAWFLQNVVEK